VVFSFFFNIHRIQEVAKSHGQSFAHNMMILPGLWCVRLIDILDSDKIISYKQEKKVKVTLLTPVNNTAQSSMQAEIIVLTKKLKDFYEQRKFFLLENRFINLKRQWNTTNGKVELHNAIDEEKRRRSAVDESISEANSCLQKKRRELHFSRYPSQKESSRREPQIDEEVLFSRETSFVGSDNGLRTLSETCKFNR
jgi:hypothetical protein